MDGGMVEMAAADSNQAEGRSPLSQKWNRCAVLDREPSLKLSRAAPSGQLPTLRAARAGQAILPS
jgi:hypothetical protein